MSLALDFAALRERFLEEWDDPVHTIFANEEAEDPDETVPYVRFSINPGNRAAILGGDQRIVSQLGRVWLQIFLPKNFGTVDAYDLADRFIAIFQKWRSDDGCVRTNGEADTQQQPAGENGTYQVNVSIPWESLRRE